MPREPTTDPELNRLSLGPPSRLGPLPEELLWGVFRHTSDAVLVFDPATDQIIDANAQAHALLGYTRDELLAMPISSIQPSDMGEFLDFVHSVLATGFGRTEGLRCRRKDGRHLWLHVSAFSSELDERRCLVALLSDVSERKEAEVQLARSEKRFQMMFERSTDGVVLTSATGTILYASPSNTSLLGYPEEELIGRGLLDLVHAGERTSAEAVFNEVVGISESVRTARFRVSHQDGSWRWIEARLSNLLGELSVGAVLATLRDITDFKQEEEAQKRVSESEEISRSRAAVAEERYKFLLQASTMLSSALDSNAALEVLAHTAVPALADLCMIDMVNEEGDVERIAVHGSEGFSALVERLKARSPDSKGGHPAIRVLQTGEPVLVPEASEELLRALAPDEESLQMLKYLDLSSCLCVPIVARSSFGTLTLLNSGGHGRRYGESGLALAQDLARRAALALDNAKLFEASNQLALTLQRSLLPAAIPKIPGAEVAARYHAAGEGNQVGGDFYDLFQTGDDGWAAVMGDVCGKGAEAAALTALARHTIRAAKMQLRKPRRILAFLNQVVMQSRHSERFMTVAYCRLRPHGKGIRVTIARAGHLAPLVLRRDGRVMAEGRAGSLIGVLAEPELSDRVLELGPGDSMILYTDGVTEARGLEGRFGQPRLTALLRECAGLDAEAIADRIEEEVLGFQVGPLRDDMALMVIGVPEETPKEEPNLGAQESIVTTEAQGLPSV
jgi:PAS domain S-box-containing protein